MEKSDVANLETFKVIKIGTYKNLDDVRFAMVVGGFPLAFWDERVLKRVYLSDIECSLELVIVSAQDIGFPHGASYLDIVTAAAKLGLDLCPAEVGIQLRLNYLNQPEGEILTIAMWPINVSSGCLVLFKVTRLDGNLWLDAPVISLDTNWGRSRFVFVRRKQ